MKIEKDKKGKCWIVSHERAGYHEQIWLTEEEIAELYNMLKAIV